MTNTTDIINETKRNLDLELLLDPKNIPTVHSLRNNGYKVRIIHWRYPVNEERKICGDLVHQSQIPPSYRSTRGGVTEVEITTPDGQNYFAQAHCHINDCFNRKLGVKIALGRICKRLQELNNRAPV